MRAQKGTKVDRLTACEGWGLGRGAEKGGGNETPITPAVAGPKESLERANETDKHR